MLSSKGQYNQFEWEVADIRMKLVTHNNKRVAVHIKLQVVWKNDAYQQWNHY